MPVPPSAHVGVRLFGAFLCVATVVAALAAASLWWPHGALAEIWRMKETSYRQLLRIRPVAGGGFDVLAAALGSAAVGWIRRRRWAWQLSVALLGANLAGGLGSAILRHRSGDFAGAAIEALLLAWLLWGHPRHAFPPGRPDRPPAQPGVDRTAP
jgi:hypothetical protein